jgi:hydroxypyruvate reductase
VTTLAGEGTARRALLEDLYTAAVAAAAPGPAVRRVLDEMPAPPSRVWLFALGKASLPMAEAAVASLTARGLAPAGGLVVPPAPGAAPHAALEVVPGDHPEPGPTSLAAAEALGRHAAQVQPNDEAWVLLSGGATALLGAPVEGIAPQELTALYSLLLGSGLDITAMNRIRKRFSRWGGGRLAAALAPARVRVLIVSDVIGDDLPSIGSGPCVPDPTTAREIREALEAVRLWDRIPPSLRARVLDTESGRTPETPKPGDPAFAAVDTRLVVSNRLALEAAAARATALGLAPTIMEPALAGEASDAGRMIARTVLSYTATSGSQPGAPRPICLIWGGETTVTLGDDPPGLGGRSQELALSAARVLAGRTDDGAEPLVLAAGTDGRDGPTDAAGAIVGPATWDSVRRAGRDPARDLVAHDSYRSLDAVNALLRPGLTGTNVMDVVFGIR